MKVRKATCRCAKKRSVHGVLLISLTAFVAGACAGPRLAYGAEPRTKGAGRFSGEPAQLISGFERPEEFKRLHCADCTAEQSTAFATQGRSCLKAVFEAHGRQALMYLAPQKSEHFDLSGYALIAVDVKGGNGGGSMTFGFCIYETQSKQFHKYFEVPRGGVATIRLDLRNAREKGMNLKKIRRIDFYVPFDYGHAEAYVDNLRLIPEGHISVDAVYFDNFKKLPAHTEVATEWHAVRVKGNPQFTRVDNAAFRGNKSPRVAAKQEADSGGWAKRFAVLNPGSRHKLSCLYRVSSRQVRPYMALRFLDVEYRVLAEKQMPFKVFDTGKKTAGVAEHSFSVPETATDMEILLGAQGGSGDVVFDAVRLDLAPAEAKVEDEVEQRWRASWIWAAAAARANEVIYARTTFSVAGEVQDAYLLVNVDNVVDELFVNGKALPPRKAASKWHTPDLYEISSYLRQGKNAVAVKGHNEDGPGALILEASVNLRNGRRIVVATDKSWKVSKKPSPTWFALDFDDTKWAAAHVVGRPPVGPWGDLAYHYLGHRDRLHVVAADVPASAAAGETIDACVTLQPETRPLGDHDIFVSMRSRDAVVARTRLKLPRPTSQWKAGKGVRLGPARLSVPRFLKQGECEILLESEGINFVREPTGGAANRLGMVKLARVPQAPRLATVQVKPYRGAPAVFINGMPIHYMSFTTLGTYRYGKNPILSNNGKYQRQFTDAGINIFSFSATNGWNGPDQFDYTETDQSIAKILEVNPNAYLMLKLWVAPVSTWWLDLHPEEATITAEGKTPAGHTPITYASKKFRADAARALRKYVEHMRNAFYADRVIGYMVCWGGEEWLYWGWQERLFPDYNPQVLDMFRSWLKQRYKNDVASLRKAWHNPGVTFETAEIATKEDRTRNDNYAFRDPQKSQHVIDYYQFFAHLSADTILYFAKVFKDATDGKAIVGVHYGYIPELAYSNHRLQHEGHLALSEVLASPLVDFYVSPQSYGDRAIGQTSTAMIPAAAVTHRNRMHYIESDARTFLTASGAGYGRCATLRDTIEVLRREFTINLCTGSNISWLDLGDGWYDNEGLVQTCGLAQKIGNASMHFDRSSAAEVAVIIDEKSATYQSVSSQIPSSLISKMRYKLNRVGAPYDMYLLTDLEQIRLEQYRLIIFSNLYAPDKETRQFIKERVAAEGRTLLWMFAPGYAVDGRLSVESMRELTGITIRKKDIESMLTVKITKPGPLKLKRGHSFGESFPFGPVFYADDPKADVIGRLSVEDLAGFCLKKMPGHTAAYLAVPTASVELLRALARHAGVHIYNETNDALYANHHFLTVHTATAGERRFALPKRCSVYGVYAGKVVARNTTGFTLDLPRHTTRLYFMGTQKEIERFTELLGR